MQALRAHGSFAAQPQLRAIVEARAGIYKHASRINFGHKARSVRRRLREDAIRVGRAVLRNMRQRFVQPAYHPQAQHQRQPLGVKVCAGCGQHGWIAGQQRMRSRVRSERNPSRAQPRNHRRQKRGRQRCIHQQRIKRIAHRRALHL